ncbi:MAG: ATP-binding protein [Alphaproteobacteria bacterium]|nr:ATP-binding protein [Alphaproteobacteria bacterium]
MIPRLAEVEIRSALDRQAAVAIIGPRQVGKTTLAHEIAEGRPSVYLDLESLQDRARLQEPELYFQQQEGKLVILDEIHRVPDLFQPLRGVIDRSRRAGRRTGLFLILGSASIDLLRQSGETLAGRIAYVDLTPVTGLEVEADRRSQERLWLRGGFPDSLLARSDSASFDYRRDLIRTYLERDVPQFGPRIPAQTLRRLWTMLAHNQGQLLNASRLAASLGVSSPTVSRYIDLLADLLLVRRLPPFIGNAGKRLVKSPKVYVRDSGLVHSLLGLRNLDEVLGHPVAGSSWEGFVLETLIAAAPDAAASFYRTAAGAEVDLVLEFGGRERWAIEIKRSASPSVSKGLHSAIEGLKPKRSLIVHVGEDSFPLTGGVEAIGLRALGEQLRAR